MGPIICTTAPMISTHHIPLPRPPPPPHLSFPLAPPPATPDQMVNIDADGATSMMWHAAPHVMDFDPHSGDYGLGFFGNALESGAYYVDSPTLGPLCYLCDLESAAADVEASGAVTISPKDGFRAAVFLEPVALYLQAECGTFSTVSIDTTSRTITIHFSADAPCLKLRLRMTKTSEARPGKKFAPTPAAPLVRGAYEIAPAGAGTETTVVVAYSE